MSRIRSAVLRLLARGAQPFRRAGLHGAVRAGRRLAAVLGPPSAHLGGMELKGGVEHNEILMTITAGTFEPQTLRHFENAVSPGSSVLDVGANIGIFSLLAAQQVGASGRVIAVEPDPRSRRWLSRNAVANGFADVISVVAAALGSAPGTAELVLNESDPSQSALGEAGVSHDSVMVRVMTGDELLRTAVDVVKIDVEGREIDVLKGLEGLFTRSPDVVVFCELNPRTLRLNGHEAEDLTRELERQGFHVQAIDEDTGDLVPVPQASQIQHFVNLLCRPATRTSNSTQP